MKNVKLFVFGLDRAGKTALLFLIRTNSCNTNTKPTLGFDITKMVMKDVEILIWDAPGQSQFRNDWGKGFNNANILLFILDTSNKDRFAEAKKEFDRIIKDPATKGLPLLFCFHKIDLPESKSNKAKAKEIFKLNTLSDRTVLAFETSIYKTEVIKSIQDAITDLVSHMK
jgi:small GTP-binding protein